MGWMDGCVRPARCASACVARARASSGMFWGRLAPNAGDARDADGLPNRRRCWQCSQVAACLKCFEPSPNSSSNSCAGGDDAPLWATAAAQCRRPQMAEGFYVNTGPCLLKPRSLEQSSGPTSPDDNDEDDDDGGQNPEWANLRILRGQFVKQDPV